MVLQIIRQLLDGTSGSAMAGANPVDESGIGVVSPYLGQVNAIIDVLKKNQISLSFGEVEDDGPIRPGIEVKSVDGYQVGGRSSKGSSFQPLFHSSLAAISVMEFSRH